MGGIFISYRQSDGAGWANWLYGRLSQEFGAANLFRDVNTTEPGLNYVEAVEHGVGQCEVLIAVIGPKWLTAEDTNGKRRLEDPRDLVRLEIERALARNIRVIPLLTDRTPMPTEDSLPDSLKALAFRNAVVVTNENSETDIARLVEVLKRVLRSASATREQPPEQPRNVGPTTARRFGLAIGLLFAIAAPIAGTSIAYILDDIMLKSVMAPAPRAWIAFSTAFLCVMASAVFVARSRRPLSVAEASLYWGSCTITWVFYLAIALGNRTPGLASLLLPSLLVLGILGFLLLWRVGRR